MISCALVIIGAGGHAASLGHDGEVVGLEIDGCIEMADAQTGH